jgi:hypothetical protein
MHNVDGSLDAVEGRILRADEFLPYLRALPVTVGPTVTTTPSIP